MQLFKRLLLSYFPDNLIQHSLNPASMFISFISSKDFFSIINRKIIENYKLNLFDVSLDAFEFKIGLGTKRETTSVKTSDVYYGYLSASNFNGYKFYNVSNTSNALVLASSLYLAEVFEEEQDELFIDCLYALYLLSFLFVARIKVFPWKSDQEDFNWFVELFFDFYFVVLTQLKHKISQEDFKKLRKKLITKLEVFFLMFYYYRRLNQFFSYQSEEKDYFIWLFGEQFSPIQRRFFGTYMQTRSVPKMSLVEEDILFEVAPADIHLKYLFLDNDPHLLVTHLIKNIYDKKILDKKLASLMKNPSELDFVLDYVTDPTTFKKGYFKGVHTYFTAIFRDDEDDEEMEEFGEMMSVIGDDMSQLDNLKVPQRIKRESRLMEQLLNFYVTYVGGLSIERADTFFVRLYKPALLRGLLEVMTTKLSTPESLHLYGLQQYFYSKNTFFYAFVNKNIRGGKEKFFMPLEHKTPTIKSNVFSLTMFDEMSLLTLLQDVNPKICKLYIKNKAVLDWFQQKYGTMISALIKFKKTDFVVAFYIPLVSIFDSSEKMLILLQAWLEEQDIVRLKDALYSFDIWVFRSVIEKLPLKKLKKLYSDSALLTILANLRELFPGFLLYYHFMLQEEKRKKVTFSADFMIVVFFKEILGLDISLFSAFRDLVDKLLQEFDFVLALFAEFDDNKMFFSLLWENWKEYFKGKDDSQAVFTAEDILWLRGTLKHITYYNKRYLIPG